MRQLRSLLCLSLLACAACISPTPFEPALDDPAPDSAPDLSQDAPRDVPDDDGADVPPALDVPPDAPDVPDDISPDQPPCEPTCALSDPAQCLPDGKTRQSCVADARGCPGVQLERCDDYCHPDTRECATCEDACALQEDPRCDEDGAVVRCELDAVTRCAVPVVIPCQRGECEAGVCTGCEDACIVGAQRCSADQRVAQVCERPDPAGCSLWQSSPCAADTVCLTQGQNRRDAMMAPAQPVPIATCVAHECEAADNACLLGRDYTRCLTNAHQWRYLAEGQCPASQRCASVNAAGVVSCACDHGCPSLGAWRCQGAQPQTCVANPLGCRVWQNHSDGCTNSTYNATIGCSNGVLKCLPPPGANNNTCLTAQAEACPQGAQCTMGGPGNYYCQ